MSRNKVGIPFVNPLRYVGPGADLIPIIKVSRQPTSSDDNYPLGQFWLIGDSPTSGTVGDLYYLCDFVAGVPTWCLIDVSASGSGIDSIRDQVDTPLVPAAGVVDIDGAVVANAANPSGIPLETVASAADLLIQVQVATERTGAPGDTNDAGICSFDDTAFAVDADGYVTLVGGPGPAVDSIDVDFNTAPGTDPVVPSATGVVSIFGNAVVNGTNANSPVATHSRAVNQLHIDVQLSTELSGAPADPFDAGISSYDDTDFAVDANGYTTRATRSRLIPNFIENLGIKYTVGTGVFTIQGALAALSATNPAYITLPSKADPGDWVLYTITSDQSFIDDNGTSEIIGNLFGHTTGRIVDEDIPFFIYAVPNDDEDTVQFMISRVSHKTVSPAAANIGAPDDAVADNQSDFWSFDNIDETLYDGNPCLVIGGFRMQMSASDDWTVQTLDDEIDGIGKFFESHYFTQVKGHYSADASSYFVAGAGTVPAWTTENLTYTVQRNGQCNWQIGFSGDGGGDGAGAVDVLFASPFFGPNVDYGGGFLSQGAGGTVLPILFVHTSVNRRRVQPRNAGNYQYSTFTNGARQMTLGANFKILDS